MMDTSTIDSKVRQPPLQIQHLQSTPQQVTFKDNTPGLTPADDNVWNGIKNLYAGANSYNLK